MKTFGKRLHAARAAAGLTLGALGERVGVSPVMLCYYEKGHGMPRAATAEKLLAFIERQELKTPGSVQVAGDPPKKKRGRPRKAEAPGPPRKRAKWGRPKKVAEVVEQRVSVACALADEPSCPKQGTEARGAQSEGAGLSKSPVRLGVVNQGWVEQQTEAFIHARGTSFGDGTVCVVVLRKRDIIELGRTLLEACGTKVSGEGA